MASSEEQQQILGAVRAIQPTMVYTSCAAPKPKVGEYAWEELRGKCLISEIRDSPTESGVWRIKLVDITKGYKWYRNDDEGTTWWRSEPSSSNRSNRRSSRRKSRKVVSSSSDDDDSDSGVLAADVSLTRPPAAQAAADDAAEAAFFIFESIKDGGCLPDSLATLLTHLKGHNNRICCEHLLQDMMEWLMQNKCDNLVNQFISRVTDKDRTALRIADTAQAGFTVANAPKVYRKCAMKDNFLQSRLQSLKLA